MNEKVFVDSNVLVYSRDASEPQKQPRALEWMAHLWKTGTGCLSFQVLQEFYVTVTQKLKPGMKREDARADIRSLLAWHPVPLESIVLEGAWSIQDRYSLSWWDSIIASTAVAGGCEILLSEDFQDGQVLDGVRVVNPFRHLPA